MKTFFFFFFSENSSFPGKWGFCIGRRTRQQCCVTIAVRCGSLWFRGCGLWWDRGVEKYSNEEQKSLHLYPRLSRSQPEKAPTRLPA